MRILVVEDNRDIAELVFDFFESSDVTLDYAANGLQGYSLASEHTYDCIILDIMLPGMDGLSVSRALRELGINTPIVMLTARDSDDDVLAGFQCGADDYVVKPFELKVLEARILAVVRRMSGEGFKREIVLGSLRIDLLKRQAFREGQLLKLNPTCYSILLFLSRQADHPVTRGELERHIWGEEPPEEDVLRKHIYQLRKIVDKPFKQDLITTIPKVGYRIEIDL